MKTTRHYKKTNLCKSETQLWIPDEQRVSIYRIGSTRTSVFELDIHKLNRKFASCK